MADVVKVLIGNFDIGLKFADGSRAVCSSRRINPSGRWTLIDCRENYTQASAQVSKELTKLWREKMKIRGRILRSHGSHGF